MQPTIEQRLDRLEFLIRGLAPQRKPVWVTGREVAKLTGWNNEKMRMMRDNDSVKYRRYGKQSIRYDLNSIHPSYLLK